MIHNFLRIALRHLSRNGLYAGVNILGLGVALACCIIAYLNYSFDRSFDTFHEDTDRIYRVTFYKKSNGRLYGFTPLPLARKSREDMAGVAASVSYTAPRVTVKHGEQVFHEAVHFVDGPLLQVFNFPLLEGNSAALRDPSKILLTREMAEKYFGETPALGKEIILYAGESHQMALTVGGVLENPPLNTSIHFDFLTHPDNLYLQGKRVDWNDWKRFADVTFLKLNPGVEPAKLERELLAYAPVQNKVREDWAVERFVLEPFRETAHNGRELAGHYLRESFPPSAVWGPIVMALLLFLTACLNFVNTTVSLSDRRLKEMGIRKVLGGSRRQLVVQLLSESALICLLGLAAAVVIADLLIPPYNAMWPWLEVEADYFSNPGLLIFVLLLLASTVLFAGSYPAFYISAFNPVSIFRGKVRFGGNNLFTRMLLGLQVVISLVAVIGGLAFAKNAKFQQEADLGYDRQGLLVLPIEGEQDYRTLRNELQQNPDITGIAPTSEHIGYRIYLEDLKSRSESYEALRLDVGEHYPELMGLNIVEGRSFRWESEADRRSVLVNQRLANVLGEQPVGRQIEMDSATYNVIGVVKDFVEFDFFSPQRPLLIAWSPPEEFRYLAMRIEPAAMATVKQNLKGVWNQLFPFRPFEVFSQEEVISEDVLVSTNIKVIFLFLAIVTIVLSSVGFFALVSLNIMKRLREIAIRRIVGATSRDIAVVVNRNFIWIFAAATILGSIGGAFLSRALLDSIFEVRVELGLSLFLFSALTVFLIAVLTVSWRLRQVIRVNPAEILRQ